MRWMTNKELFLQIKHELGNDYQVGLHNSTKEAYILKVEFDDKYQIKEEMVTEDNIISNILKRGLYVPIKFMGLTSTVTFFNNLTTECFNYSYYRLKKRSNDCYVLVIAIPKYIYINDKKYNIVKNAEFNNFMNYSLFHTMLPKELIYGYYKKQVLLADDQISYIFDDYLDFYPNERFYGNMNSFEQEEFWLKYFKANRIDISMLENGSHSNLFDILFSEYEYSEIESDRQLMEKKRCKNKQN